MRSDVEHRHHLAAVILVIVVFLAVGTRQSVLLGLAFSLHTPPLFEVARLGLIVVSVCSFQVVIEFIFAWAVKLIWPPEPFAQEFVVIGSIGVQLGLHEEVQVEV